MYGMNVKIVFKDGFKGLFCNCSEVHYNYPSVDKNRVAFESDYHHTGCTQMISEISEMEVRPAEKFESKFWNTE